MQMQLLLFLRPSSGSWRASCVNTAGAPPEQRAQQGAGMFTGTHAKEHKAHRVKKSKYAKNISSNWRD